MGFPISPVWGSRWEANLQEAFLSTSQALETPSSVSKVQHNKKKMENGKHPNGLPYFPGLGFTLGSCSVYFPFCTL